jgi:NAD(P)H dehydrogenase (quinone)
MQVLITYFSRTGNTKKLAEAVAQGVCEVEGVTCLLKPAADVTESDLTAADAVVAGSPDYFGSMAAELKALFERAVDVRRQLENKVGAAFATSGDPSGGKETTLMSIVQALLVCGMCVVGPPLDAGGYYGVACTGAPDAEAKRGAAELGRRVATLIGRLQG